MRTRFVMLACAFAVLGVVSCVKDDANPMPGDPDAAFDATYEVPERFVPDGGGPIVLPDAKMDRPADSAAQDGAVESRSDTREVAADRPPDRSPDHGTPVCDLLKQNCSSLALACYPNGTRTTCDYRGFGVSDVDCQSHLDCDRGLICAQNLVGALVCRTLCDTSKKSCPTNEECRPLAGQPGVGYCAVL